MRQPELTFNCDLCGKQITDSSRAQTTEHTVICLPCIEKYKVSTRDPVHFVIEKRLGHEV
jgi:hypothetical protein